MLIIIWGKPFLLTLRFCVFFKEAKFKKALKFRSFHFLFFLSLKTGEAGCWWSFPFFFYPLVNSIFWCPSCVKGPQIFFHLPEKMGSEFSALNHLPLRLAIFLFFRLKGLWQKSSSFPEVVLNAFHNHLRLQSHLKGFPANFRWLRLKPAIPRVKVCTSTCSRLRAVRDFKPWKLSVGISVTWEKKSIMIKR